MPLGETKVRSLSLGIIPHMYGPTGLAKGTFTEYDDLFQLAKELANLPSDGERPARFTSVCINVDFSASLHVDSRNEGSSWVIAGGGFEGGELWENDVICGRCHDVRHKFLSFDGSRLAHKVLPFKGSRLSFVYFNNDKGSCRDYALLNAWRYGTAIGTTSPSVSGRYPIFKATAPLFHKHIAFLARAGYPTQRNYCIL